MVAHSPLYVSADTGVESIPSSAKTVLVSITSASITNSTFFIVACPPLLFYQSSISLWGFTALYIWIKQRQMFVFPQINNESEKDYEF